MSCTLMYQPYAMPYSSCDRSSERKIFKFPHVPSPPDSSHSGASSYSGHSSSASSATTPNIPLYPSPSLAVGSSLSLSLAAASAAHHHHHSFSGPFSAATAVAGQSHRNSSPRRPISPSCASGPSATITSPSQKLHSNRSSTTTHDPSASTSNNPIQGSNHQQATATVTSGGGNDPNAGSSARGPSLTSHANIHENHNPHQHHHHQGHTQQSHNSHGNQQGISSSGNGSTGAGGTRAQYLSANCVVYESYDGDSSHEVDEHFSRALSSGYNATSTVEKSAKTLPMSTRNFPPSFWNSAYQPPVLRTSYGATGPADFYGSAMDYGSAIPAALAHHHQTDPWHYPLTSHHHHHHQSYHHHHHRAAELAYPSMPSTSRFNPAQYGSFLFPGAAATSAAGRFSGIPGSSHGGVKGEGGHWGAGGRYHPHESSWSDFHLADYSAAAAHYSNMTAGLDFESHYLQSS